MSFRIVLVYIASNGVNELSRLDLLLVFRAKISLTSKKINSSLHKFLRPQLEILTLYKNTPSILSEKI